MTPVRRARMWEYLDSEAAGIRPTGNGIRSMNATPELHAAHAIYSPRLLRLPDVIVATGCGRSTIYDAIRAGTFPQPVPLGGRSVAWPESEIAAWIDARIAERDAKAGAA